MRSFFNLLIVLVLSATPFLAPCQKLAENKIDEFTKQVIKRTSYEVAVQKSNFSFFVRISKVDSLESVDIKMISGDQKIYSISSGMEIMLMLENGEIIALKGLRSVVSCKGCGARGSSGRSTFGIENSYGLDVQSRNKLLFAKVKKLRIYTADGFVESELNDKYSTVIGELIFLID